MMAVQGQARDGMEPDDLLCSRNARSRAPLVGLAQWKTKQLPSTNNMDESYHEKVECPHLPFLLYCGSLGIRFNPSHGPATYSTYLSTQPTG